MRSLFKVALLFIGVYAFTSCSQDNFSDLQPSLDDATTQQTQTDEFINVRLQLDGDILELKDLLTRSGESDDLFGIKIYSSPIDEDNYTSYAFGLYDDVDLGMNLSLLVGRKYHIQATLFRNGKNIIDRTLREEDGVSYYCYEFPFYSGVENALSYGINHNPWAAKDISCSRYWYNELVDEFNTPDVDRYYGEVIDFIPGSNVTLSMKRVSARVVFNVTGLKGSLDIAIYHLESFQHVVIKNSTGESMQLIKMFTLPGDDQEYYTPEWLNNPVNDCMVSVNWYREDGTDLWVMGELVTFQAGKSKTIDIDLSSYYAPGPGFELPGEDDWD